MNKTQVLRKRAGLSQTELAFRARVHPSLVSRLEAGSARPGRPGVDGLIRIAEVLAEVLNEPVTVQDVVEEIPEPVVA